MSERAGAGMVDVNIGYHDCDRCGQPIEGLGWTLHAGERRANLCPPCYNEYMADRQTLEKFLEKKYLP